MYRMYVCIMYVYICLCVSVCMYTHRHTHEFQSVPLEGEEEGGWPVGQRGGEGKREVKRGGVSCEKND